MGMMFLLSESAISNPTEWQGWTKPSTGQAYVYLNSGWVPFASGDAQSFHTPLTVLINGIDRTDTISLDSFEKQDNLTNEIDTAIFTLDDNDGTKYPQAGEIVDIFKRASAGETPEKIFGGEVLKFPQYEKFPGESRYLYEVECVSYEKRLNNRLVTENYEDDDVETIVKDLIDSYAPEFSYNNVLSGGPTVAYISFDHKEVGKCIEELCEETGLDWYADEEMDIHVFTEESNAAPYEIASGGGNFRGLVIETNKDQLRTRITVQGGYYLSTDYSQYWEVQTDQRELPIAYEPYAAASGAIELYINGGSKITPGIDNIDTSDDYVVNRAEKVLKDQNSNWNVGDNILLVYQRKIIVNTQVDDLGSQETVANIMGGSGIIEHHVTDSSIVTIDAANERGLAEIRDYAGNIISGSFITKDSGYRSGQIVTVNLSSRNISSQKYLIRNVATDCIGGAELEYNITFATHVYGLVQLLQLLYTRSKELIIRPDETLHLFDRLTEEEMEISEATATTTLESDAYQYGPGGDPQGVYHESIYG